eukprot:993532-Lingulodinium_polyedra.AAC.1
MFHAADVMLGLRFASASQAAGCRLSAVVQQTHIGRGRFGRSRLVEGSRRRSPGVAFVANPAILWGVLIVRLRMWGA